MLEKAPRMAVYIPPNTPPWDDAVTLALEYADIPYTKLWDEEVRARRSREVRLAAPAPRGLHRPARQVLRAPITTSLVPGGGERCSRRWRTKLGFAKVTAAQGARWRSTIKDYVGRGGFMFGMCSATDTYDIALAARGRGHRRRRCTTATRRSAGADRKLDYSRTLAFKDFRLEMDPILYRFSGHRRDAGGGRCAGRTAVHAVRLLGEERSGAHDAGAGPRERACPSSSARPPASAARSSKQRRAGAGARSRAPTR